MLSNVLKTCSTSNKKAAAILLLLLNAGLFAPLVSAQPVEIDSILAVVDQGVVLRSEFDERWKQVEEQLAQTPGQKPPEDVLRKQLMEQLIIESLQLQMASSNGIRIDDNQLNQAMQTIAAQNNMSFEQFRNVLQEQGVYQPTREAIRKQMTIDQFENAAVMRRINITRQEIENFLRSETGLSQTAPEYHVAHILIPNGTNSSEAQRAELADLLFQEVEKGADIVQMANAGQISGISVSGGDLGWNKPENLPTLFRELAPQLNAGETAEPFSSPSGYHIVKLLETRGGATLNVEQYDVSHILIRPNEIRTEEQSKELVWELYERIKNGEDFADIARQNTDDKNSIVGGGNLDWVDESMAPPDFMAKVKVAELNVVTEPFRIPTGWHILEVRGKRIEDLSQENARRQAQMMLRDRKYENEKQNWITELRDTSHVEILDPDLK